VNTSAINHINWFASGKNLATASFALTRSICASSHPNACLNTLSSKLKAYFAPKLLDENNFMYQDLINFTSIVIAPSSCINQLTGSIFAKNL
jgi:hypothetical protein